MEFVVPLAIIWASFGVVSALTLFVSQRIQLSEVQKQAVLEGSLGPPLFHILSIHFIGAVGFCVSAGWRMRTLGVTVAVSILYLVCAVVICSKQRARSIVTAAVLHLTSILICWVVNLQSQRDARYNMIRKKQMTIHGIAVSMQTQEFEGTSKNCARLICCCRMSTRSDIPERPVIRAERDGQLLTSNPSAHVQGYLSKEYKNSSKVAPIVGSDHEDDNPEAFQLIVEDAWAMLAAPALHPWWVDIDEVQISGTALYEQSDCRYAFHRGKFRGVNVTVKRFHITKDQHHYSDEVGRKFRRDVRIRAAVRHPNVLTLIACAFEEACFYQITEEFESGFLAEVIEDSSKKLPWSLRLTMLTDTAVGLAYLHHFNPLVTHGSLTSHSLLVDRFYRIRVDFMDGSDRERAINASLRRLSAGWIAPEARANDFNQRRKDAGDVYAFGVIVWEICTRQLYATENEIAAAMRTESKASMTGEDKEEADSIEDGTESTHDLSMHHSGAFGSAFGSGAFGSGVFGSAFGSGAGSGVFGSGVFQTSAVFGSGFYGQTGSKTAAMRIPKPLAMLISSCSDPEPTARPTMTQIVEVLDHIYVDFQKSNTRSVEDVFSTAEAEDPKWRPPELNMDQQRTNAKSKLDWYAQIQVDEISLKEVIGRGAFGVVYKGIFRQTDVAVKVFSPKDDGKGKKKGGDGRDAKTPCMVHRDLKTANILLADDFDGVVADFGFSGFKETMESHRRVGTMTYLAPEVISGGNVTEAIDIYALGIVCSELATGERPYGSWLRENDERRKGAKIKNVRDNLWTKLSVNVAMNGLRPGLEPQVDSLDPWHLFVGVAMGLLAKACWNPNPVERPHAGMITTSLVNLCAYLQTRLRRDPKATPNEADAKWLQDAMKELLPANHMFQGGDGEDPFMNCVCCPQQEMRCVAAT
eukprot:g3170.t1